MKQPHQLKVTSHVGRDLLDAAAVFKNEAAVVWEYVVNSLQYVASGISPRVQVIANSQSRTITISDNGRGMSAEDLAHFFMMHGENRDRNAGRPGRGKFGTGKSAAFGIANCLQVDTRRNSLRNVVLLTRDMIDQSSGEAIPLKWLTHEEETDLDSGTKITISELVLDRVRTSTIIEYIERHLQAYRATAPEVAVNAHVCEYREPEMDSEHKFAPNPKQASILGEVELTVKVARSPLPELEQGVAITAGLGNLVAIERCGLQSKDFGNYLWGEVDVPAIESVKSSLAPYDPSRSLQLNAQHPVAAVLLGFIGASLEKVRCELVNNSKMARKSEEARRLALQAEKIAEILNEDFSRVRDRLREIRSASARSGSASARAGTTLSGEADIDSWVIGTQEPGFVESNKSSGQGGKTSGRPTPSISRPADANPDGDNTVDPAGSKGSGPNRRNRGGFSVQYRNLGEGGDRSVYDATNLYILINLDHPVVSAALGNSSVEDSSFRRLSYEIAFGEYAMALGHEICQQDPNIPADDLLFEVRSSLNRVAVGAASLYRSE